MVNKSYCDDYVDSSNLIGGINICVPEFYLNFLLETASKGSVQVEYIKSEENVADIFTKPHPPAKFRALRSDLKVVPVGAVIQGSVGVR